MGNLQRACVRVGLRNDQVYVVGKFEQSVAGRDGVQVSSRDDVGWRTNSGALYNAGFDLSDRRALSCHSGATVRQLMSADCPCWRAGRCEREDLEIHSMSDATDGV